MLKNTLFLTATFGLALFAPACGGDKDGGSGITGDTGTGDDDDDDDTVTVAFEAAVACDATGTGETVSMYVQAPVDNGSKALIDMADTNNDPSFYETHTLLPSNSGAGFTEFNASVSADAGAWVDGVSSIFSCAADTHFQEAQQGDVMTYIVRAYAADGTLFDCFAAGNDPTGMVNGDYDDYGNTIDYGDVSAANCATRRSAN